MRKSFIFRIVLALVLIVGTGSAQAQDATVYTPAAYSSILNNYILEWTGVKPDTTGADFTTSVYLSNAWLTTHYFDGLGRPLQTIAKQGSLLTGGSAADLITAHVYDSFSREPRLYLAFAANGDRGNTHISDGAVTLDPFQQQVWWYSDSNSNSPIVGQGETYYYGKTEYEPSPLNRPLRVYGAGNNWVSGSGRGTDYSYWVNTSADSVKIWMVTNNSTYGNFGTYAIAGSYTAGELYKNVTTDEKGVQTEEFKDRENKVILKKVQLTAASDGGSGSGYSGWLCTYYVYDTVNRLRCVIQPATVAQLPGASWTLSSTMLNESCFRYEYDSLGRNIVKKTPGAGAVWVVYDQWDRVALSQDSNLRVQNEWLYTKYDPLDRPIVTGFYTDVSHTTLSSEQSYLYAQNLSRYETFNNANYPEYSLTNSFPSVTSSTVLTYTYYDNYNWAAWYGAGNMDNSLNSYCLTASNTTWPYPQALTEYTTPVGKVMGVWENVGPGLLTAYFYDSSERVIQTHHYNFTGGVDETTTQYSFTGQPLVVVSSTLKYGANADTTLVITQMTYDSLGRVAQIQKKISNRAVNNDALPSSWETVAQYDYDGLGHLAEKSIGNKPGYPSGTALGNQVFAYNIRGWLLSINKSYVDAGTNSDQYFGMELGYDKNATLGTFTTPQYSGNIAGMLWKGEGDQAKRKYDFSYDQGNRLTGANFNQYVSGSGSTATFDKSAGIDYSVNTVGYDANGNILNLLQKGWKISSSVTIDSLTYGYYPGSNRLDSVIDGASDTTIRLGDFTNDGNRGSAYSYDGNGNLIADSNKKITSIVYNYLNLPTTIYFRGKGHISYLYDTHGAKLEKTVVDSTYGGSKTTTTKYLGEVVFVNDTLQYVTHEEGRIRYDTTSGVHAFYYDYFLKDHLGNTRMVLTEQPETDAYPDASLEDSTIAEESLYYGSLDSGRINKSIVPGYPNDTYTNPNNYIQELSGATGSYTVGANVVLKVMAGDTVNIRANSWYNNYGATPGTSTSPLASLVAGLAGGIMHATPLHFNLNELEQPAVLNPGVTSFLTHEDSSYNTAKPMAYLNWVLFDEQFHYVAGSGSTNSGFQQVGADTVFTTHTVTGQVMTKSGYLFIYVSNETPNITVYFDNLQVTHIRGRIVEESHYYPFGLLMAGVSAQAAGKPENLYKFNKGSELQHKEFSDGSGLDWYNTTLRELDPQIGRWWQIDSKPAEEVSPYSSMGNNPITNTDAHGDSIILGSINSLPIDAPNRGNIGNISLVTVRVEGKLINETSNSSTPEQMQGYADRMNEAVTSYYSVPNVSIANSDISVESPSNPLQPGDHAYRLEDPSFFRTTAVVGVTPFYQNVVYMNATILPSTPATTGPHAGTGISATGDPTLERTSAHETGHSAGLKHPDLGTAPGNLMNQSYTPDAGTTLTPEQIQQMLSDYNNHKLNQGEQVHHYVYY